MHPIPRAAWIVYLAGVFLPIGVPATLLAASVTWAGCRLGDHRKWGYYPGMLWSRLMVALTWCPCKVEGLERLEPGRSYVLAANHTSAYDIFAIYGWVGRPFKWIMKKELRHLPVIGRACEEAGFIFVNRHGGKQALASLAEAEDRIRGGVSIAIFPEGSRTITGKTGDFKRGGFEIARDMHLPVVPISLSGNFRIMPRGAAYPIPHRMKMVIHPPVEFNPKTPEEEREMIARVRQTVVSGIDPNYD